MIEIEINRDCELHWYSLLKHMWIRCAHNFTLNFTCNFRTRTQSSIFARINISFFIRERFVGWDSSSMRRKFHEIRRSIYINQHRFRWHAIPISLFYISLFLFVDAKFHSKFIFFWSNIYSRIQFKGIRNSLKFIDCVRVSCLLLFVQSRKTTF